MTGEKFSQDTIYVRGNDTESAELNSGKLSLDSRHLTLEEKMRRKSNSLLPSSSTNHNTLLAGMGGGRGAIKWLNKWVRRRRWWWCCAIWAQNSPTYLFPWVWDSVASWPWNKVESIKRKGIRLHFCCVFSRWPWPSQLNSSLRDPTTNALGRKSRTQKLNSNSLIIIWEEWVWQI